MVEIQKEKIKAYALENAVNHGGKAVSGAVINALFTEGLKKEEIKGITPIMNEVLNEINALTIDEQKAAYDVVKGYVKKREQRTGLPELPEATKGKVVMRIAPFPSGPLHIGNARPFILNDQYCKDYEGKLILVIDDTMGSEEKPVAKEAYKMIPEGLDWLGIKYDKKIIYKSDRLQLYYDYAEELIKKDYMYVCSCSQEEMRDLREKGQECACRNLPDQLERWKEMFKAKEGKFTVRLKTSMQDPNPAFRDRVMFRITNREHPKVGKKYSVWPLLDFSWAVDDHLLGITHILRGVDLMMETKVEEFIWNIFKWKVPKVIYTGFLAIEGVKISKSKGSKEVRAGTYIGWNDPRLWSLQSLQDRGILPESIREFILAQGITKSNSTVAIDVLYSLNRKNLEKVPRYFFIENPVKIHIKASPNLKAKIPLHPSLNLGDRTCETMQDFWIGKSDFDAMTKGSYRLMHLLNFEAGEHLMSHEKEFRFLSEHPDEKLKPKFIHWLSANHDNLDVTIRMPDSSIVTGFGEPALASLKTGDIVQFERFGFCKLHKLDKKENIAEFWFAHK